LGIYTVLDNKEVDDHVNKDLQHIVERIRQVSSAREIILGGGFGRGEGSVIIEQNEIRPVNDYDLFVIVPDDDNNDFRSLGKIIAPEIKIRLLDIIPVKDSVLSTLPSTQFYYDMKYGGRHLWGENLLETVPMYKEGHIDHDAGRTILINRLICAIEAFSEDFESRSILEEEEFFLINQTGKVVSSCIEAQLIFKNKYHHSIRERQKIFESLFPGKERLIKLNRRATEFKLRPSRSPGFDGVVYWKEAISEYIKVMSDCLAPGFMSPVRRLWRKLKKKNGKNKITNTDVERVELMLLLYREAPSLIKKDILFKAKNELENVSKTSIENDGWENLRKTTTDLWHSFYH